MIAVDTNILVYAHRAETTHHALAAMRVASLAEGNDPWVIPWPCIYEFLAVVTRRGLYDPPTPGALAIHQVEAWMASPTLGLLADSDADWPRFSAFADGVRTSGLRIYDARIAAICLTNGVHELWSADRDFSRFPGVRVVNPLAP
jgi:toxin-antitoxin system PIN domain toxin